MSPSTPAGAPLAAYTAQRVEVYCVVHEAGSVLLAEGVPGRPRLPGAVLAHGETPRAAARRALAAAVPTSGVPSDLWLATVRSDVRPDPDVRGHPGLHVLQFVLAAGALPVPVADDLLVDPSPAPVTDAVPGAPPRVQRPAAYAVVRSGRQVLLSRVTGSGVWTLAGGGIDHGEHPDDTVRRETFEETGLDLVEADLLDADSLHFTGTGPRRVAEDFHGVRLLYTGRVARPDEPVVQEVGGSTDAAAWVELDRLDGMRLSGFVRAALAQAR